MIGDTSCSTGNLFLDWLSIACAWVIIGFAFVSVICPLWIYEVVRKKSCRLDIFDDTDELFSSWLGTCYVWVGIGLATFFYWIYEVIEKRRFKHDADDMGVQTMTGCTTGNKWT
jgi:hypothetical protein